jgi:hypothetical protein
VTWAVIRSKFPLLTLLEEPELTRLATGGPKAACPCHPAKRVKPEVGTGALGVVGTGAKEEGGKGTTRLRDHGPLAAQTLKS